MRRKLLLTLLTIASLASFASAQSTSVTLQVTDAASQSWNNGSWTVALNSLRGATNYGPPFNLVGGGTAPNQTQSGLLNASGGASLTLTPNASVLPSQSGWQFSVCPAQGVPFQCFVQFVVITGASQTVTLIPPAIAVYCGPGVNAYADSEVNCQLGGQYYNVTTPVQRQCTASTGTTCTAWTAAIGNGSAAATAIALASTPTTCTAQAATGVDASGNALGCFNPPIATPVTTPNPFPFNVDMQLKGPNPSVDIRAYGARTCNPNAPPCSVGLTASTTSGLATVTISAASTFVNGDGVVCYGCGAAHALATP